MAKYTYICDACEHIFEFDEHLDGELKHYKISVKVGVALEPCHGKVERVWQAMKPHIWIKNVIEG